VLHLGVVHGQPRRVSLQSRVYPSHHVAAMQ
jgi:hypothetical protein